MPSSPCLSEENVAELVEGRLEREALESAERHISECPDCMRLVGAAARAMATSDETLDSPAHRAPAPPLERGATVGRYEIIEMVGAGGMGRVYSARDPVLDRRVALKLLHPHAATDQLETRLLREAKAMARLSHPEVITVHDAGRYADQLFIAMEFVDGSTLRHWVGAKRRPWREVLGVYLRAGRGLARAHEAGIVHRDFKPDNVLVGDDGRVRVTDFGLARAVQSSETEGVAPAEPPVTDGAEDRGGDPALTRTGTLLGTPAYMAPEQHWGAPADERSDVYSFCVSLYEGLYGERPFPGPSFAALMTQKQAGKVPPPQDDHGVPPRVRRAILVGLRLDPADRYPTMQTLLVALEHAARTPRTWLAAGAGAAVLLAGASALGARALRAPGAVASTPVASAPAAPRECTTRRACVESHGGGAWTCRASDGTCVALASEDCAPLYEPGDLEADDTVWLGAMFPVKGPAYGKMNMDGTDMARKEFARETRALTGSGAATHVPRIALVGCDDSKDPSRAATHLVDDVGVPAILGFGTGKELVDLAGGLLIPRGVLAVATLTESPVVTRLPQPPELPRMVWRTSYSVDAAAHATAAFVRDVLQARTSGGPARVALVREDMSSALPFAQTLHRALTVDGKPAGETSDDYREVLLAEGQDADRYARAASTLAEGRPTIVVFITSSDQTLPVVKALEAAWPLTSPRPTYVLAEDSTMTLAPFVGTSLERRRRVFATTAASVPATTAHFVLRFNLEHPGGATETLNPGSSYDAFYMLAYAVFASGEGRPVSGPALARALPRLLPPGHPIETGPTDVLSALRELAHGNIDLSGPSGSLDFDPSTGEWEPDFTLLCAGIGRDGRPRADVDSGVTYVAVTGKAAGSLRCP